MDHGTGHGNYYVGSLVWGLGFRVQASHGPLLGALGQKGIGKGYLSYVGKPKQEELHNVVLGSGCQGAHLHLLGASN